MGRRRIHLRAGRTLVVRAVPPQPAAKVDFIPEPSLLAVVPVHRVEGEPAPTYHAEFVGHTASGLSPFPTTTRLRVVVLDGRPAPLTLTIPVTIWPSVKTLLRWWVIAYLGIVGLRWKSTLAGSASVRDVFAVLVADLPYLFQLLLLGAFVLVPLRVVGWAMTLTDPGDDG